MLSQANLVSVGMTVPTYPLDSADPALTEDATPGFVGLWQPPTFSLSPTRTVGWGLLTLTYPLKRGCMILPPLSATNDAGPLSFLRVGT